MPIQTHVGIANSKYMSLYHFHKRTDTDYILAIQADNYCQYVNELRDYCYDYFTRTMMKEFSLSKYDVEDFFQESFIKLWTQITTKNIVVKGNNIFRWKHDTEGVWGLYSFTRDLRSYLVDIGKNDYKTAMRKKHEDDMEVVSSHNIPQTTLNEFDRFEIERMVVADSLNNLPKGCQSLLRMFIYDQLSNEEVLKRTNGRYSDADSLKTGKNKCMKKLKATAKELLEKFNY